MLSLCPFDISVGVGAFVIGLSQISSFFSYAIIIIIVKFIRNLIYIRIIYYIVH